MTKHGLDIEAGLPGGSPLVRDYLEGVPEALTFYQGWYRRMDAYRRKAKEVDGRFGAPGLRERAARMVIAPSEGARRGLERFVSEGGYFVTTGQQPGLLTGPLYTIYKALTAIRLAETLASRLAKPVLPLFWIASEDHDWAEVNHAYFLDRRNLVRKVELSSSDPSSRTPVHRVRLGTEVELALGLLRDLLPPSEHRAHHLASLEEAYAPGATLPGAFRLVMERLLAPYGLLFVDAAAPDVKAASLDLLQAAAGGARSTAALLAETGAALGARGYGSQVTILPKSTNLFLEHRRGRERVDRDGAGFRLHPSGDALSRAELREKVDRNPAALSPNVLLRPIVESALFPVLSYVAGPGELAYYGQLRACYRAYGMTMPVIHPRSSITIIESKTRKVLEKYDLGPDDLSSPPDRLAARLARDEIPGELRNVIEEMRETLGRGFASVSAGARAIDPTLRKPLAKARARAAGAIDEAERKLARSLKRRDAVMLSQLEKARNNLHPLGRPQERVLNPFHYLVRYGDALIPLLADAVRVDLRPDSA